MSETHPIAIRLDADEYRDHTGRCYDDEQFTHAPEDTLYVRRDMIFEYLLSEGYDITVRIRGIE